MTVKLDGDEIYKEIKNSIARSEERSKNYAGGYPVGYVLRIDFKDELRAAVEEVFISYKNILC